MFRKLRRKLTLINVGVMALLLLLFIICTFFVMRVQVFNQSQQLMQIIASEAGSGTISNPREHDKHLAKYFYLKTDGSGRIIENSSALPMDLNQLTPLIARSLHSQSPKGEVELKGEAFTYLKVPLKETPGFIITFVDLERDKDILQELLLTLSIGGLVCLGLAYYGSRFMADRAMAPIKSSWRRQQDFVADASHELRTPLTVVQVNLDIVKGNPEETVASQAKWIDNSLLEMRRMSKLVDDLLFLARADSQQQTLNLQSFSLKIALSEVLESFNLLAQAKGIILESSLNSEGMYYGDESRIKQLMVILLDNAIKYTPSGGYVSLGLQEWGTLTEITVSDTGEGIEKEYLSKIFERFYRIDLARSQQKEGTGLGLAIADWIVKSHHGRIKVTSSPGKGTAFVISLPKGN